MTSIKTYLLLLLVLFFSACKKDDDDKNGDWQRRSDFEGVPRNGAFVFTIGDNSYVGTGYDGDVRLSDMWMYNGDKNTWYQMAAFPGAPRSNAVGFSLNGKGYVGTGYDGNVALKDFWEYDPKTNQWKRIADLPASARYDAVAFTLNNKGYVGTGRDNDEKDQQDFYSYDALSNHWEKVNSLGVKRSGAFAFVIGDKAYVGGGRNNGQFAPQFYEFTAQDNLWTLKRSLNARDEDDNDDNSDDDDYNITRANAACFVIGNMAYIACGTNGSALNDTWSYNVATDIWKEMDAFEGYNRQYAVGFSFQNKGFVTTGINGNSRFDDTWFFDPFSSDDED